MTAGAKRPAANRQPELVRKEIGIETNGLPAPVPQLSRNAIDREVIGAGRKQENGVGGARHCTGTPLGRPRGRSLYLCCEFVAVRGPLHCFVAGSDVFELLLHQEPSEERNPFPPTLPLLLSLCFFLHGASLS